MNEWGEVGLDGCLERKGEGQRGVARRSVNNISFRSITDLKVHSADECSHRPIHCPVYRCQEKFPLDCLEAHLKGGFGGHNAGVATPEGDGEEDDDDEDDEADPTTMVASFTCDGGDMEPLLLRYRRPAKTAFLIQLAELSPSIVFVWATALNELAAKKRGELHTS